MMSNTKWKSNNIVALHFNNRFSSFTKDEAKEFSKSSDNQRFVL